MNFKLHSEFAPTGDQPTAIEKLSEGLQNGEKYQTLLISDFAGCYWFWQDFYHCKCGRKSSKTDFSFST